MEIARALEARRKALEEDTRRARERREQIRGGSGQGNRDAAHDAAIVILDAAVAVEPGNADVRHALEARQAALAREQDEARRAREREERIASAIARAKKMTGHEEAIAIIREGLALDAKNATLRALLDARQGRARARAGARRLEAERHAKIASTIKQAKGAQVSRGGDCVLERRERARRRE